MDTWSSKYVQVLENLSAKNLQSLGDVTAHSVCFVDPFNDTRTQLAFISIMQDMFTQLSSVKFVVHTAVQQDDTAFIYWTFHADSRFTGPFDFQGTSLLKANEEGKVVLHHDFWDGSILMQKVPVLGSIIKRLRIKLGHK